MISRRFALLSAVLIGTLTSQAQAVSLAPGGTVSTPGTTIVPTGTQLGLASFAEVSLGNFTATLTTQAVLVDGVGVGFLYQVANNSSPNGTNIISAVEVNFVNFSTDVDYTSIAPVGGPFVNGTVATTLASRPGGSGSSVTFDFVGNGIAAGATSNVFFVQTNAPGLQVAIVTLSGSNGSSVSINSFGPSPVPVPEPSVLAMAFTAVPVFGLAGVIRRRRKAVSEIG